VQQKTKKMTWLKKVQYIATALVFLLGIADAVYLIFWYGKEPVIEQPQLEDFSLHLTDATGAVARVVGGIFEGDQLSVRTTHTATGDLNGDGRIDAVVVADVDSGGTGRALTLFLLLNSGHEVVNTDKKTIDSRAEVTSLGIENGIVAVGYRGRGQSGEPHRAAYRLTGIRFEEIPLPAEGPSQQ